MLKKTIALGIALCLLLAATIAAADTNLSAPGSVRTYRESASAAVTGETTTAPDSDETIVDAQLEESAASDMFFGSFEAENLRGDTPITEAYFAEADLTLVNFWATWCGPCREEIPALAQIAEKSEGRFQVLGVMLDSLDAQGARDESAIEAAHTLLDAANAAFPVVVPDDYLSEVSSAIVVYVPTTVFVDRQGNVVTYIETSLSLEDWMAISEEILNFVNE